MELTDFSRINGAVDIKHLANTHIIGIGAGGACKLYNDLARTGIGKLTVFDFDTIDESNITRQGFLPRQIGMRKVDALAESIAGINSGVEFVGITKNFLSMSDEELDGIFTSGDLFLFLTDSFEAQAFGNILALRYKKPAIWGGFYEKSQCAEIVFTAPRITKSCFRCAVSPRYDAQAKSESEIKVSSSCNTVFHSALLDAQLGMLTMALLHNDIKGYEFSEWFGNDWVRNLLQFKVHPSYGTEIGSLFQRVFQPTEERAFTFNSIWQTIEPELPPKYEYCPDCHGLGYDCSESNTKLDEV